MHAVEMTGAKTDADLVFCLCCFFSNFVFVVLLEPGRPRSCVWRTVTEAFFAGGRETACGTVEKDAAGVRAVPLLRGPAAASGAGQP